MLASMVALANAHTKMALGSPLRSMKIPEWQSQRVIQVNHPSTARKREYNLTPSSAMLFQKSLDELQLN